MAKKLREFPSGNPVKRHFSVWERFGKEVQARRCELNHAESTGRLFLVRAHNPNVVSSNLLSATKIPSLPSLPQTLQPSEFVRRDNFRVAIDLKRGDHFLLAGLWTLIPLARESDYFWIADHSLTDLSGMADHLLELAAKLPREAGRP